LTTTYQIAQQSNPKKLLATKTARPADKSVTSLLTTTAHRSAPARIKTRARDIIDPPYPDWERYIQAVPYWHRDWPVKQNSKSVHEKTSPDLRGSFLTKARHVPTNDATNLQRQNAAGDVQNHPQPAFFHTSLPLDLIHQYSGKQQIASLISPRTNKITHFT